MGTTIPINGTEIYYERRGTGPPLLFITGATGDAGWWDAVAAPLADTFTVIAYDRRANSRSPRPTGWTASSVVEQADDAAALLHELDLGPATVFGGSAGALYTCELVIRHPDVVTLAFVQEPPIPSVLPYAEKVAAEIGALIEAAMPNGPRAVVEQFLRLVGQVPFDALPADLRERVLGNAEVLLNIEMPMQASYAPDPAALRNSGVSVQPLAGVQNRGLVLHDSARWLADGLGVEIVELPGGHVPFITHPEAVVELLRSHA